MELSQGAEARASGASHGKQQRFHELPLLSFLRYPTLPEGSPPGIFKSPRV